MGKKNTVHFVSVECFPLAKVGGLADVVGALPQFLNKSKDWEASVIIPFYDLPFYNQSQFTEVYSDFIQLGDEELTFAIKKLVQPDLGFEVLAIDIPPLLYRPGVYADQNGNWYEDEVKRFIGFQLAYLEFIDANRDKYPSVIHVHDHHTGLIPFMLQNCYRYKETPSVPTIFTIHNEQYHGEFSWSNKSLLPKFPDFTTGLLDWNGKIDPLASAIKCAWHITTVSPFYMKGLQESHSALQWLFINEKEKSTGILNGIDIEYWNPKTDQHIDTTLENSIQSFKSKNKKALLKNSKLDADSMLVCFIGRLVYEKGIEPMVEAIYKYLNNNGIANFYLLGSGNQEYQTSFEGLQQEFPDRVKCFIGYDEPLSHQLYAASDFLLMPSRVEPCGLNQMYAMRYGTIPIVHNIGGLHDSVEGKGPNQTGIKFDVLNSSTIAHSIWEAEKLFLFPKLLNQLQSNGMSRDNSWENSSKKYIKIYEQLQQFVES